MTITCNRRFVRECSDTNNIRNFSVNHHRHHGMFQTFRTALCLVTFCTRTSRIQSTIGNTRILKTRRMTPFSRKGNYTICGRKVKRTTNLHTFPPINTTLTRTFQYGTLTKMNRTRHPIGGCFRKCTHVPCTLPSFLRTRFPNRSNLLRIRRSKNRFRPIQEKGHRLNKNIRFRLRTKGLPSPFHRTTNGSSILRSSPIHTNNVRITRMKRNIHRLKNRGRHVRNRMPLRTIHIGRARRFQGKVRHRIIYTRANIRAIRARVGNIYTVNCNNTNTIRIPNKDRRFKARISKPRNKGNRIIKGRKRGRENYENC